MIKFVHNLKSVNESVISYKDGDLDDVRPCTNSDRHDVDEIYYPSGEPGLIMNWSSDFGWFFLLSVRSMEDRSKPVTYFFGEDEIRDFEYRIEYKTEEEARKDFNRIAKIIKKDPLFYLIQEKEAQSAIKKLGFKKFL